MYRVLLFLEGTKEEGPESAHCVRSARGLRGRRIEKEAWQVALKTRQGAPPRIFIKWGQSFEVEGVGTGVRRNTLKGKEEFGGKIWVFGGQKYLGL